MSFPQINQNDYELFHELANAYYREGEDADTPQAEIDSFIRFLFEKVIDREISGCFAAAGDTPIGFALWTVDSEGFAFSEIPGMGTILEIGLLPAYRASCLGKELVAFIEHNLRTRNISQCYVSAYGPAQKFWKSCGYAETGKTAKNDLPILMKTIHSTPSVI